MRRCCATTSPRGRLESGSWTEPDIPTAIGILAGKRRVYKHLRIFRAVFRRRAHAAIRDQECAGDEARSTLPEELI